MSILSKSSNIQTKQKDRSNADIKVPKLFSFFSLNKTKQSTFYFHNSVVQHRPTLEHEESKVSTTAKVTTLGKLPVRKRFLF